MTEISEVLNRYTELSPEMRGEVRVFKETRVSVWFVLTLIEEGWSQEHMANQYSSIPPEAIAAVFKWCEEQQNLRAVLDALREVY